MCSLRISKCWYIFAVSCFCFFRRKTAYEMRISDWSSDVCSSDLALRARPPLPVDGAGAVAGFLEQKLDARVVVAVVGRRRELRHRDLLQRRQHRRVAVRPAALHAADERADVAGALEIGRAHV